MANSPRVESKTIHQKIEFAISEPVIGSNCRFFVGYSFEEMKKIIDERKHPKADGLEDEWEHSDGFCITIKNVENLPSHAVWLKHFDWDVHSLGVLSHEVVHLVMHVFKNANIPVRIENDEVFAYMQEFYFTKALEKLNKIHGNKTTSDSIE